MKKPALFFVLLLVCFPLCCEAQQRVNALFVGNSYTQVNDLPQMVQQVAASMGDELTYQSNTPGGCTFSQHCSNQSMSLICNGGWDVVVLQEQGQYPSFPQSQVEFEVFPYAQRLVDSIYAHNPCCEPLFYMTWGRKNGDAANAVYFPVLATYEGMDSMLCERYTYMAQQNDASLCPVGRVWRYLREHHADIELYQSDGIHPSVAGSYAAACAFYTLMFHRDPDSITFSAGLSETTARIIRSAAHQVVYADLAQWQRPRPQATFQVASVEGNSVTLVATAHHADSLLWDYGDGSGATTAAADTVTVHTYAAAGDYTVTLTASRHCMQEDYSFTVSVAGDSTAGISPTASADCAVVVYPNPASDRLSIVVPTAMVRPTATLYALDGRVVAQPQQAATDSRILELHLGSLPEGEYLLQLADATHRATAKVIVHPLGNPASAF